MAKALSVARIVNVSVSLAAIAAASRNFGAGCIAGDSDVIDVNERIRSYNDISGVLSDFASNSPEALAATLHFSQNPRPKILYIGRWASAATKGRLNGAILTPAQQVMENFTAVTNGGFKITIDGTERAVASCDFSAATNLNGVASIIQTKLNALSAGTTCVWDGVYGRFIIRSGSTGATSTLGYGVAPASGTDISVLLGLTSASGAGAPVGGVVAETALQAAQTLADYSTAWYALQFAATVAINDATHQAIGQFIEACAPSRIYGVTLTNTNVLDPAQSGDLGSVLKGLTLSRTYTQYSSSSPYAAASFFGRASTVNFEGSNTTITMMFKQEPGVTAENLPASIADALKKKNVNVFVTYDNGTAILQHGTMANGYYFDEIHGTDWLQNRVQIDVYNLIYQAPKIPQTDPGSNQIANTIDHSMQQAVRNGLVAPGQWNGPDIGQLKNGDWLDTGYYIYYPPYASQAQADREARKSVPFQVAMKLAGAVHEADILMVVNR